MAIGIGALGITIDPYAAFNFSVEINGLIVGGFTEVSGLQSQIEVEEYKEGGENNFTHKLPGRTVYSENLVLKRGLTDIEALWRWYQDVAKGIIKRRNGTIYLLDQRGLPAMWWDFRQAYPVKWSGPEFKSDNTTVAFETVELVHQGIVKPTASSATSTVRGVAGIVTRSL
ncbi:phage tail protein [Nostoc sp. ChiVER01]|uniref:phage tail protein n=1 Tax=Nostoc sp. ChiVER01 TaxID=3075382 RepID=UPI002AD51A3B|nr:phage tail protein [Nostoc sp. ChiVER01]MDZ8228183.1 phage tail protein [Nostoc sp. ChiVER01]